MKIDFYYWDNQCPINYETLELLKKLDSSLFDINFHDITDNQELAKKMKMYFPSLTVFNDFIRWRSPININLINNISKGVIIKEEPYIVDIPRNEFTGNLVKLTGKTISGINKCCTMTECIEACFAKGEFLSKINGNFLGYLHYKGNKIIGGAEYIPTFLVPYDIPKDSDTAFLTCSYLSSDTLYDNKAYPLRVLEKDLSNSFKRILAISDEQGVFPNGNLKWFKEQGYKDEGIISTEENYAKLHLVSKIL
ncbi:hypothetical protein [Alkaliphilus serpentinus]|uniref:Uncharacterized protein n=1 Tax=Alkaliphilus serpentinus TaxID=1482731 RepID=A0A833HNJ3_9FIRM|nr:hypothetical protein [Alkaliphilus serpentinus]KAB3529482.1 hypothetical protein F8153_09120 [Alkaliphilus serpentinus]